MRWKEQPVNVNPAPNASTRDTETRPTRGGAPFGNVESESDRVDGTSQVKPIRRIREQWKATG